MHQMFEREQNREKNLTAAKKQAMQAKPKKETTEAMQQQKQRLLEEKLRSIEDNFFQAIGAQVDEGMRIGAQQDQDEEAVAESEEDEIPLGPLTVYFHPYSPYSRAVASFCGLAQIDHSLLEIDVSSGEQKSEKF